MCYNIINNMQKGGIIMPEHDDFNCDFDHHDFDHGPGYDDFHDGFHGPHPGPPPHRYGGGPFPGRQYDTDTYIKHYAKLFSSDQSRSDSGGSRGIRATLRFYWNSALVRFITIVIGGGLALELIYAAILYLCGVRN